MRHPAETPAPIGRSPLTPGERRLAAEFVTRVRALLGDGPIRRILVFGSRARGEGHADSDLDLAVFGDPTLAADTHRLLTDLARQVQDGQEDLPHLRPVLIRAGDPIHPALLGAIDREGIELWASRNG